MLNNLQLNVLLVFILLFVIFASTHNKFSMFNRKKYLILNI